MTLSPDHIAELVASEARMRGFLKIISQTVSEHGNGPCDCMASGNCITEWCDSAVAKQALSSPSPEISKLILDVLRAAERKKEEAIYQSRTHNVFCGCNACELWKAVNALRAAAPWLLDGRGE
jgi:hypothetical protein